MKEDGQNLCSEEGLYLKNYVTSWAVLLKKRLIFGIFKDIQGKVDW